MQDPQQEIFTQIKLGIESLGYDVYDDGLPPENTPYPFVYMGDCGQDDEENKTAIFGRVNLRLHVWHTAKKRGDVSRMLLAIKTVCRMISHTDNFAWTVRNISQNIIKDNTTKTTLNHGILDVEFSFS